MTENPIERTLIIIKPDGIARRLAGKILARVEELGLVIVGIKMIKLTPQDCQKMYPKTRQNLPQIYTEVEEHLTGEYSVVAIFEGEGAINKVRTLRGPTNLLEAPAGTIRHDLVTDETRELFRQGIYAGNLMHAPDDKKDVGLEINLFFGEGR